MFDRSHCCPRSAHVCVSVSRKRVPIYIGLCLCVNLSTVLRTFYRRYRLACDTASCRLHYWISTGNSVSHLAVFFLVQEAPRAVSQREEVMQMQVSMEFEVLITYSHTSHSFIHSILYLTTSFPDLLWLMKPFTHQYSER